MHILTRFKRKAYMKKFIPELLERQGTGGQEEEGDFGVFGPNRRSVQNIPNDNFGSDLIVSEFADRNRRKPIGKRLAASRREDVTGTVGARGV